MKKLFLYAVLIAATSLSCRKIETDGTTVVNNGGGEIGRASCRERV